MQEELLIQEAETRRLDEISRLKSYFVSSVSHDLQTPLTSIKMFAEILQNNKQVSIKDKSEYLEIIQGETDRLSRLINNVLDFSRIERGEMKYNFEQIELIPLIEWVLRTMKYQMQQKQFEIVTSWPDSVTVFADKDALSAALMNLISNVIKYSEQNRFIKISVSKESRFVVICIEDRGIGIPKIEQNKIFNTFDRSSDKEVQALGGSTLVLTLVRNIIEALNDKIKVESKPGKGTKFILTLPIG